MFLSNFPGEIFSMEILIFITLNYHVWLFHFIFDLFSVLFNSFERHKHKHREWNDNEMNGKFNVNHCNIIIKVIMQVVSSLFQFYISQSVNSWTQKVKQIVLLVWWKDVVKIVHFHWSINSTMSLTSKWPMNG